MKNNKHEYPEYDDEVVYYVIYNKFKEGNGNCKNEIIGWSDDKGKAEAYYKFHKSPNIYFKKLKGKFSDIYDILNQNINEQIYFKKLKTVYDGKVKNIIVPITTSEEGLLFDEIGTMCSLLIDYGSIMKCFGMFKKKYQKALSYLYLLEIAHGEVYGENPEIDNHVNIKNYIEFDELRFLFRLYPTTFGMEDLLN